MTFIPKEAIEVIAQSIGITNLSPDVALAVAPDVEYRMREIMQEAVKCMRHARRTVLRAEDVDRALKLRNVEDLSFNNIREQIPGSLFGSTVLTQLFLGNNRLTGPLPAYKDENLVNIDVSYNYLSGSIPSWINRQNLQINLVANNFTLESSSSILSPAQFSLQSRFSSPTVSASSLRYYGLGLENGNYTVTLQFAEIADLDTTGRRSLGGVDLLYANDGSYGPLISAISAAPDFETTVRPPGGRSPITQKNRTGFFVGGVVAWHLYENNRQLELVDSKLSIFSEEEVISLIWGSSFVYLDIALIEASDVHVIAMLCGDIEVSAVNSKPGYLTEWTFDDAASYVTDDTAEEFDDTGEECDDTSNYISSTSLSRVDKTPQRSATKALLH
ncbi:hypothetical protein Pint_05452 [Pistacia integerrima]|uniref:Uncharacterized protein n=1 Tax=Pistacia integerrima TaxID=434235 RepID=A0ACC0Z6N5_9ROSI|nr:hypothetical protein Pint_05452 [Pistacia integerrima]